MALSPRVMRGLATLLLIAAFASAGLSLRTGGLSELPSIVAVLYVGSLLFVGVWTDRLSSERFTRATLLGLMALLASLYEPTAILAPIIVVPGVVLVVQALREERTH